MEVIRKNFKEVLPQISASIKKADFLVIDSEFTGLIKGKDVSMFDTPREYYHRLLNGSSDFLLIQFGLCSFIWDEEKDHYMNETYNFYLFPRTRHGQEKIFLCQCSSLDFLVAQGFDFNKVIRDGISYMTEPDEAKMREILAERQKSYTKDKDFISVPEENKPFIEEICKKVREFIDENKSDEMEVDRCNAFVRMLLFQELRTRFKDEIMLETKVLENKDRVLKVLRAKNQDDAKMHEAQKMEKEWEEIEDAVGFSKVARMISQSEKLVVGHNMLLDVLHTLNHFFQPLPEDYKTFKEFAHCMFPSLLDTKYMSSLPPFKDKVISSVLPHLLMTLSEPPFELPKVDCVSGRGYSVSSGRLHEAGYDAFVTGLCFLAMWAHVGRMRGETRARVAPAAPALRPFLNKLFLGKTAHQDSPYMNLNGADPAPSRDHVFHLTFPKEWTRNDIGQLFSAFGPVTVQFEDESHALVALARREHARHALRAMLGHNRVILQPYNHYKARQLQSQNHSDQEGERSRQLCAMTNRNPELRIPREIRSPPVMVPGYMYPLIGVQTQMTEMHVMTTPPANMNTMTSPPTHIAARKRTSSGVFQVDDAEPSPKKAEHARAESEGAAKKTKAVTNGKWKVTETSEIKDVKGKKKNIKEKKLKVIDSFDCEVKSTCVTAFKESDSWD